MRGGLVALPAAASNLVQNPDFATDLDGWTVSQGNGNISLDATTGAPAAPSMQVKADGTDTDTSASSSCMPVDDSNDVDLHVNINGTAGFAIATIATFSDADCTAALSGIASEAFPATGDWETYSMSDVTLPDGAQSARIVLTASMGASTDHGDAHFDHVEFGPTGTALGTVNVNQEGLSGTWYNPATSGQGMQFVFSPDDDNPGEGNLFGAWYTYDISAGATTSSQRWYSVQTALTGDAQSATVRIYRNTDGNFDAPPVTSAEAGRHRRAHVRYLRHGRVLVCVRRWPRKHDPAAPPAAERQLRDDRPPDESGGRLRLYGHVVPESDERPRHAGRSQSVRRARVRRLVSYAAAGEGEGASGQRWFSAQSAYTLGDRTFPLTIYTSTGGSFDTGGGVITTPVGTATLTFTSCVEGTFDYTFTTGEMSGKSGTIPLTRLGPVPQSCQSFGN